MPDRIPAIGDFTTEVTLYTDYGFGRDAAGRPYREDPPDEQPKIYGKFEPLDALYEADGTRRGRISARFTTYRDYLNPLLSDQIEIRSADVNGAYWGRYEIIDITPVSMTSPFVEVTIRQIQQFTD